MGFPTKVQLIQRKKSQQWYINFPSAVAHAMEFERGETVEWIIEDNNKAKPGVGEARVTATTVSSPSGTASPRRVSATAAGGPRRRSGRSGSAGRPAVSALPRTDQSNLMVGTAGGYSIPAASS